MSARQAHRGPHPEDRDLFAADAWPRLQRAVAELSWLLSRGYAMPSSIKLVGDRHRLNRRQRVAVQRSACSDQARQRRTAHHVAPAALAGQPLLIDGFNLITTVEAALAGGVLLRGRDTAVRDMASMHGSYRKVTQTRPALELIGEALAVWRPGPARWLLDSPVSNSRRLAGLVHEVAQAQAWPWQALTVVDPDRLLGDSDDVVISSDSVVLDRCPRWFNLVAAMLATGAVEARVVELNVSASAEACP